MSIKSEEYGKLCQSCRKRTLSRMYFSPVLAVTGKDQKIINGEDCAITVGIWQTKIN